MRAAVHQVVTFATDPFRGNPAFVLSLEEELPDRVLQQVAAQLREDVLASVQPTGKSSTRDTVSYTIAPSRLVGPSTR